MNRHTLHVHRPEPMEVGPSYRIGWATSEIVSAINTVDKVLASGLLDHDDAATWERNYEVACLRSDLGLQARSLRAGLDVLDPKGTSVCRERLEQDQ